MKINTALILCAGFGKRLNPITIKTPKPLLIIKGLTLLDHCINLIVKLEVKKILINSFYLKDQINEFVKNQNYNIDIEVIEDGESILDTGGGILNLIDKSEEENFLIFNPDTIWNNNYTNEINQMINLYFNQKLKNILLLVKKDLSFDKSLLGDFGLENNLINKIDKKYIYTGCQILNKSIFKNKKITNFSITKIWADLIKEKQMNGFESTLKFYHVTNVDIFKKLRDL
ncbi:sugar phosphate nucleotidyltransferase [Candidatus Pelagibacter sp.]|nr:sugar phosphate nucleotidyltransferase [Candidatus Pelagibacter sp.]